jgi:pimeloyl-ACP methyl ester carboxylesterase
MGSARRLLRLLLLVQAGAIVGLAWGARRWLGVGPLPAALGLGLGVVLLVRLLLTANSFRLSARFGSATPAQFRLGAWARARLFGEEFLATMLYSSWFMPRARARAALYPHSPRAPLLLLHGYGCNSGYWAALTPLLDAARISHVTLDLEPMLGQIDGYVPAVRAALEALCAATGARQAIIVGHSMGGLVARAYLRAHGAARVARVITLGTPHHGTRLADFGPGLNAAQMRRTDDAVAPESAWLRTLAASENAATRALFTSFYSHHDNIVAPQDSSVLEGARNRAFGGVGHVALGRDRRILAQLMDELESAAPAPE